MTQLEQLHITREVLTDGLINEMIPLLKKHWVEIAHYPDIPMDPNWEAYMAMQDNEALVIMTVRVNTKLVGYIVYFVHPNIHYQGSLQAVQDVLFIDPSYRKGMLGIRLLKASEAVLKGMGVQVVMQHLKFEHDFSPLLERLGYHDVDKIMAKRLD